METEKQDMKSEMDVDDVLATSPQHLRKKVGIAFDDDGAPTSGFVIVGKDSDEYRKCANDKSIARRMLEARQSWAQRISAELENEDGFLKLSPANSAISRAQNSLTLAEERTA
jgi:hypothetical protein